MCGGIGVIQFKLLADADEQQDFAGILPYMRELAEQAVFVQPAQLTRCFLL